MRSDVQRLILAAKAWATFQEGDRLDGQQWDSKLQDAAIEAREKLLQIIDEMPD